MQLASPKELDEANRTEETPAHAGAALGLKAGLALSSAYAALTLLAAGLDAAWQSRSIFRITDFVFLPLVFLGLGLLMGALPIIAPSAVLGMATGALVGKILESSRRFLTVRLSTVFGIITCLTVAVALHILFEVRFDLSSLPHTASEIPDFGIFGTYPVLLGVPTLIYVVAGGWASKHLFSQFQNRWR